MRLTEYLRTVRLGIDNVRSHKLRSVLTVLGIVFGVCSVISMLAITGGGSAEAQEQLRRLGSSNIILRSLKPPQNPEEQASENRSFLLEYGLTYNDAELLVQTLPNVDVLVPIKAQPVDLWVGHRKLTAQLAGTVSWMRNDLAIRLKAGRFIEPLDLTNLNNVIVLNERVALTLFRYEDPLNKPLKVGGDVYRVVGIVQDVGGGQTQGVTLASQSADCFVPITTLRARQGDLVVRRIQGSSSAERVELTELILKVHTDEQVISTAEIVEKMMATAHPKGDFQLIVPLQLMEAVQAQKRIFSIVLSCIAAISLLVGGIGIMNIMLASVSERTREIGVRRALGARRRDIMAQFLVETLILSVGGGILGMILGAVIPWLVTYFSDIRTILTPGAFIVSFAVSAIVGLVFGLYPARRAAMMDPIEALRHE
jgi:putative ABC transport system permease protein